MSIFDTLVPADGPANMHAIHRFALAQAGTARRRGDVRAFRQLRRLARKALRTLRYAALIETLRVPADPACSHPLFSDKPEKPSEPLGPTMKCDPDRRRCLPEDRWRS